MIELSGKKIECSIYDAYSAAHRISYVAVAVRWKGNWLFIKRPGSDTYEIPCGFIRRDENPFTAARRELYETTGIVAGMIYTVCNYSLSLSNLAKARAPRRESYGRLYYVEAMCMASAPPETAAEIRYDGFFPSSREFTASSLFTPLMRKACAWVRDVSHSGPPMRGSRFFEKVCGAVVYCNDGNERKYLVIRNLSGHVGFPKGHVEDSETELETAKREVREETGLTVDMRNRFKRVFTYITREHSARLYKTAVYFLAEFAAEHIPDIAIQQEEVLNWWLVPYETAFSLLNHDNDRATLSAAEQFLSDTRKTTK